MNLVQILRSESVFLTIIYSFRFIFAQSTNYCWNVEKNSSFVLCPPQCVGKTNVPNVRVNKIKHIGQAESAGLKKTDFSMLCMPLLIL